MAVSDIDVPQLIERFREGDHEACGRVLEIVIPVVDYQLKQFGCVSYACDGVLDHVLQKLEDGRFDTEGATLERLKAWVREVARNWLTSLAREVRYTVSVPDDLSERTAVPGLWSEQSSVGHWSDRSGDDAGHLALFIQVAALHGQVQPYLPKGRQVDLYGVYLFEFRRNLYLALRRWALGQSHNYLYACEITVPWGSDGSRAFRSDWPSIERLWDAISPLISQGEHVDIDNVINTAKLLEPDCAAGPDVYYRWVYRMRQTLELNYDEFADTQEPELQRAWELWKHIILKPKTT